MSWAANLPWENIGWTLVFTATGFGLMFIGLLVFDWLVPFQLFSEVEKGNEAVAWLVGGYLVSTGIVLADAFRHNTGLIEAVVYSVLGILLNYLGYFLWEWLTPRWSLSGAIGQGSRAAGIVLFGLSIAIGLIITGAFS